MHSISINLLAFASLLSSTIAQEVPQGVGCGIDGFKNANVDDCRAAISQIDTSQNVATDPANAIEVVQGDPLTQYVIVAEAGNCRIAARTIIPLSGAPVGTVFSGQKTVDFANVSPFR